MPMSNETYRQLSWADLQQEMMREAARNRAAQQTAAIISQPMSYTPVPDEVARPDMDVNWAGQTTFKGNQAALDRDLRRELQEDAQAHQKDMFKTKLKASRRGRGGGAWRTRYLKLMKEAKAAAKTPEGWEAQKHSLAARLRVFPKMYREQGLKELEGFVTNVYDRPPSDTPSDKWARLQLRGEQQRQLQAGRTAAQADKSILSSQPLAMSSDGRTMVQQAGQRMQQRATQQPSAAASAPSSRLTVVRTGMKNGQKWVRLSDGREMSAAQARSEGVM